MIKFEEHDDNLFRMLEEPVPLTDDAELPVLVRLIQDDTMLGKANKRSYHPDTLAEKIICSSSKLTDDGLFMDGNYTYCYEIIGTFVEEGSDKWALYQMMKGNKVRHESYSMPKVHCAMNEKHQIAIFTTPSSMIDGGDVICHANDWLTSRQVDAIIDERTGWQIYTEPKPTFKVGDWVKYDIDSYLQVIEPSDKERTLCKTLSGVGVIGYPYTSSLTKVSPSEVVVHIGCLSGTVEPVSTNGIHIWFHLIGVDDKTIATIRISSLDTQTRELVERLLKAQEEETNGK